MIYLIYIDANKLLKVYGQVSMEKIKKILKVLI